MAADTLLTYAGRRYLWLGTGASAALLVSYYFYARATIPSGSTLGGLIYGWLGFVAILVLMSIGIRKRWYASRLGTVQGWTSAHVYLGLLTLLIIPMHAGFRFGWDVHTLAFALLIIVVLSGVVGLLIYLIVPQKLTVYESSMLPEQIETEINRVLGEMKDLVGEKSAGFQQLYEEEFRRCQEIKPQGWRLLFKGVDSVAMLSVKALELNRILPKIAETEQESFSQFCSLVLRKTELEALLAGQMRVKNALEAWLYVHVPMSFALIVAVAIHLLVVLYY
jgi:hypothetical protein